MTRIVPKVSADTDRRRPQPLLVLVLAVLALSGAANLGQHLAQAANPPNHLINETSPYLRLHAHNPVDWYPWGPEALERARRENKPIFLSIGYSTCHWCHVMAHESFENPAIARLMNENFINIKVDREERPDLDETYMAAVVMVTGQGGWPMSVFLTPDLKPFYGGTYFPPEQFKQVLVTLSRAYRQDQAEVVKDAQSIYQRLQVREKSLDTGQAPDRQALKAAFSYLDQTFDPQYGGFGLAPKFPQPLELSFLLSYYRFAGKDQALKMVGLTLQKIAQGGIYDQLGGGFCRYATDSRWQIPHFEKMLYDNALLTSVYLAHYQLTGNADDRRVAKETLDFVLRELGAPTGGFYAALDSQSDGQEGKYYVWTLGEVKKVVDERAAPLVTAALGVTWQGNFEGTNVLTRPLSTAELASRFSLTQDQVNQTLTTAMEQLRQARARRVPPARDDKIIVSWNGLMISTLAQGTQVLGDPQYYQAAAQGARFLLRNLVKNGRLQRIWAGGKATVPAFLDDYAFLANSLVDLFETDFDPSWLTAAQGLVQQMDDLFLTSATGVYSYVGKDQTPPLGRNQNLYDQVIPAGNSMATLVCWRLYRYTDNVRYQKRAQDLLTRLQERVRRDPSGFPQLLSAQILYLSPALDLTLVGDPNQPGTQELTKEIYRHFLPERRLVLKNPKTSAALEKVVPGVRDYTLSGEGPVAYICRSSTCLAPVHTSAALLAQLKQLDSGGTMTPSSGTPAAQQKK
jgi:uncharacterized protein YyaL (SSP411 family)